MTPEDILSHEPRVLSQQQREFYFTHGYLLVERVVPQAWIDRLLEITAEFTEKSRALTESDAVFDLEPGHSCAANVATLSLRDGFPVNVGADAGQTVMHLHVHVIPRFSGDVDDIMRRLSDDPSNKCPEFSHIVGMYPHGDAGPSGWRSAASDCTSCGGVMGVDVVNSCLLCENCHAMRELVGVTFDDMGGVRAVFQNKGEVEGRGV